MGQAIGRCVHKMFRRFLHDFMDVETLEKVFEEPPGRSVERIVGILFDIENDQFVLKGLKNDVGRKRVVRHRRSPLNYGCAAEKFLGF